MPSSASPSVLTAQTTVVTPVGTPLAAPLSTVVALGDVWLESVRVIVPSGPAGCMGLRLSYNGLVYVPWQSGSDWLILDSADIPYPIGTEVDHGLTIQSYNTGSYQHSSYWQFTYIPMSIYTANTPIVFNLG